MSAAAGKTRAHNRPTPLLCGECDLMVAHGDDKLAAAAPERISVGDIPDDQVD